MVQHILHLPPIDSLVGVQHQCLVIAANHASAANVAPLPFCDVGGTDCGNVGRRRRPRTASSGVEPLRVVITS
jgi:hypothetical protein